MRARLAEGKGNELARSYMEIRGKAKRAGRISTQEKKNRSSLRKKGVERDREQKGGEGVYFNRYSGIKSNRGKKDRSLDIRDIINGMRGLREKRDIEIFKERIGRWRRIARYKLRKKVKEENYFNVR